MDFPILETERLKLVEIEQNDAESIFDIFSRDEVTKYYGVNTIKTIVQAVEMVNAFKEKFTNKQAIRWAIRLKETNEFLGTVGIHNISQWSKRAEIGYELHPDFWRKGYTSEAVLEVIKYCFWDLGLHRIGAITFLDNHSSIRLLKKIGFQQEGILRGYLFQDEIHHDGYIFSLLKPDWEQLYFNNLSKEKAIRN